MSELTRSYFSALLEQLNWRTTVFGILPHKPHRTLPLEQKRPVMRPCQLLYVPTRNPNKVRFRFTARCGERKTSDVAPAGDVNRARYGYFAALVLASNTVLDAVGAALEPFARL